MCRRYRQPHSALFGDGDGTWSPSDAGLAVAYERWLRIDAAETCPSCHSKPSEWIDPVTKRLVEDEPWRAEIVTCYSCKVIAEEQAKLPRDEMGTGMSVVLVRPASDLDDES